MLDVEVKRPMLATFFDNFLGYGLSIRFLPFSFNSIEQPIPRHIFSFLLFLGSNVCESMCVCSIFFLLFVMLGLKHQKEENKTRAW